MHTSKEVLAGLKVFMADAFVLYMKTHAFHWNVQGPHFHSLHALFEEKYTEQWQALDDIAERIRALGAFPPSTLKEILEYATLKESNTRPKALDMVRILHEDQRAVMQQAQKVMHAAQDVGDEVTFDLMVQRRHSLEKSNWMLQSILES